MSEGRDHLYAERGDLVDFAFDERVAGVFPDMIRRSVPGYENVIALPGLFAERHARPGTLLYDLGCSLGASTLAMRRRLPADADCRILCVDNAAAMLDRAREHVAADGPGVPVEFIEADLREVPIENASLVVLNFTLQFVPPAGRLPLLQRIHAGLVEGGALILSEKVEFANDFEDDFQRDMQLAFKRANGYSELEIARKRSALEQVLIPETLDEHRQRLQWAGFGRVHLWHQCFNFASLVALK